jgi:hypothetical protein
MIKCEVVFEDDAMSINGWYVYSIGDEWEVEKNGSSEQFIYREEAIKYCLEH